METRRSYTYLCLYNKTVECLIINKVYPPETDGEFFKTKLEEQAKHMEEIHESFDQLKVMTAYMMPTELSGSDMLDKMADMIYGDSDPIEGYAKTSPMHFETKKDIDYLYIKMPFIEKADVELFKTHDNSIIIETSNQKRTVALPATLRGAEILGAGFSDGNLVIRFRRQSNAGKKDSI